mmetsp:Transcript_22162/g.32973  ORF Transcript_22162/g.32973 Transcript_22162/m.32973 type:complete len:161 (+) Transcript_22162:155-637(+)
MIECTIFVSILIQFRSARQQFSFPTGRLGWHHSKWRTKRHRSWHLNSTTFAPSYFAALVKEASPVGLLQSFPRDVGADPPGRNDGSCFRMFLQCPQYTSYSLSIRIRNSLVVGTSFQISGVPIATTKGLGDELTMDRRSKVKEEAPTSFVGQYVKYYQRG